jgi:hypothetical protein
MMIWLVSAGGSSELKIKNAKFKKRGRRRSAVHF